LDNFHQLVREISSVSCFQRQASSHHVLLALLMPLPLMERWQQLQTSG
jgi:hypothetical protein